MASMCQTFLQHTLTPLPHCAWSSINVTYELFSPTVKSSRNANFNISNIQHFLHIYFFKWRPASHTDFFFGLSLNSNFQEIVMIVLFQVVVFPFSLMPDTTAWCTWNLCNRLRTCTWCFYWFCLAETSKTHWYAWWTCFNHFLLKINTTDSVLLSSPNTGVDTQWRSALLQAYFLSQHLNSWENTWITDHYKINY